MMITKSSFVCPNCHALYRVVRVEADPEMVEREITCRACGGPFPAREGKFLLKYFLLRKGGRTQRWRRASP
jgi:hypothetical protein